MKISVLENELNQGPDMDELVDMTLDLAKSMRKKFFAMPYDTSVIKAAKEIAKTEIAKKHKVRYQDILARIRPEGSIRGIKVWDKNGNLVPWEKVFGPSALKYTGIGKNIW
jgi:hypothetical protein